MSDYDRGSHQLALPAIELANEQARVTILPTLGGRVWSFVDVRRDRELLYSPPRLRYAAFGLSDAWFAGGIEWNLGSFGHTTMTTRPMHAARIASPNGDGEGVRLWEWERTRDIPFAIDLWLDGACLMASTRLVNLDAEDKPLYWWTNIAVPETDETRVLVPATHAWQTDYRGVLTRVAVPRPDPNGVDVSRPAASTFAADYFFEVSDSPARMVSAFEPDGRGFAQTSTAALRGRKLFLWGRGPGGRRWQEHLGDGGRYAEIQAGVCPTQLEHDLLPANSMLTWTECFTGVDMTAAEVAGDYQAASAAAARAAYREMPPERINALHQQWLETTAEADPGEQLALGSGWGHVELALRSTSSPDGMTFPEVADDSLEMLPLVRGGQVVAQPSSAPLPGVSPRWRRAIAEAAARPDATWWAFYARAVLAHLDGEHDAARADYEGSVQREASAAALRGLAQLSSDIDLVDRMLAQAHEIAPHERRLVTERLSRLLEAGRPQRVLDVLDEVPDDIRQHGRTQLLAAQALADLGETSRALDILRALEVPDLAEGDKTMALLWQRLCPTEPVPEHLDYRMMRDTEATTS
ncbi:DUF5107 domain-containing protein [Demetria terragena]|uniref:DUF5107 domain-containing protein n=1 Tax=Demetria terragena TaxID=63959 RepID=UPI0014613C49|nr:DUF5107 domain-containing protein [Demetria terragena]